MLNYLKYGMTGQVIWAITNVCNAKCSFCSYPDGKGGEPCHVDLATARKVLDMLYQRNLRIISFTGGEPLLNPDVYPIIRYAVDKGFITRTGTNGSALNPVTIEKLKQSGIRNIWISLDSEDAALHDKNRGIPGLTAHIREMVPLMKQAGLRVNAAAPVNKLIGDWRAFLSHVRSLGLDTVAFCYPMTAMAASYGGAAASSLVEFTPEELLKALQEIKELKERPYEGVRIINPAAGLEEMMRFQAGEAAKFPCLGGYKFFYLDWKLTLYRCAFLAENFGNVLELGDRTFPPSDCNRCMWQCFRDPSVFYHIPLKFHRLATGGLSSAAGNLGGLFGQSSRVSGKAWLDLVRDNFYA